MNMKLVFLTVCLALIGTTKSFGHFFWIETAPKGQIGEQHEIRIYFGEFTSGEIEKTDGEVFQNAQNFTIWVVDQNGNKEQLQPQAEASYYASSFTPKSKGTYSIILDNKKYQVLDYTQYDYGIFRPQYHSVAKVEVGDKRAPKTASANPESITIIDVSTQEDTAKLQVLFKNKPLADKEVTVFIKEDWSKKIKTDSNGVITFSKPFATRYVVEATHEDELPGSYDGVKYQFTWHCAVYTIN